jgi:hypothetical protein
MGEPHLRQWRQTAATPLCSERVALLGQKGRPATGVLEQVTRRDLLD